MNDSQITYRQNIEELEGIVKSIETGKVDLDVLATKVDRAKTLIRECRRKLRTTKGSVERIMAQVDDEIPQGEEDPTLHDPFANEQPAGWEADEESMFSTCPPETPEDEERTSAIRS